MFGQRASSQTVWRLAPWINLRTSKYCESALGARTFIHGGRRGRSATESDFTPQSLRARVGLEALPGIQVDVVHLEGSADGAEAERDCLDAEQAAQVGEGEADPRRRRPDAARADAPPIEDAHETQQALGDDVDLEAPLAR